MADYKQQQMVDAANAVSKKRKVDAEKTMTDAAAAEESGRFNRAMQHKAGAGRGGQGGPSAKELATKQYAKGGKVSSASARADGIAQRGKTKGTIRYR